MQGAYGGLICIIAYAGGHSTNIEDYFLLLDGTPFMLLSGENLILL